ncbi:MAG: hypothetical protein KDB69_02005, partial [Acidimicrobiia bacterium]|nr:hypothetical protein [Acidimicrobiia bacterium]
MANLRRGPSNRDGFGERGRSDRPDEGRVVADDRDLGPGVVTEDAVPRVNAERNCHTDRSDCHGGGRDGDGRDQGERATLKGSVAVRVYDDDAAGARGGERHLGTHNEGVHGSTDGVVLAEDVLSQVNLARILIGRGSRVEDGRIRQGGAVNVLRAEPNLGAIEDVPLLDERADVCVERGRTDVGLRVVLADVRI